MGREFFVNHFRRLDGTVVVDQSYEEGATDFTAQLTAVADAAPAVLFMPGPAAEVVLLTAQARTLPLLDAAGEPTVFLGAHAWDDAALLENEQASVDGSFFSTHFSPDTDEPTARAFVEAYRARFAIAPAREAKAHSRSERRPPAGIVRRRRTKGRPATRPHRAKGDQIPTLDRLQEYLTALISAAVTGKIDVRQTAV